MRRLTRILLSVAMLPSIVLADEWVYSVRPGDNLWDLTEKYMVSMRFWRPLLELNRIEQPKRIPPGTKLRMPLRWSKISRVGARVVALHGSVEILDVRKGTRYLARPGEVLKEHHRVVTKSDSSLLLEFGDSSRLLLTGESSLDLEKLQGYGDGDVTDTHLRLEKGGSESLVNPDEKAGTRFEISTPSALTAVRGTGFRITSDDDGGSSRVEVTSGRVQVSGAGRTRNLSNGFGLIARQGEPPAKPVRLLPAPSLTGVPKLVEDLSFSFRLETLSGAKAYRVQIAETASLGALAFDSRFTDERVRVDLVDLPDGDYQMKIRAIDPKGVEGLDAIQEFELNARPAPPFQVSPPVGAEFIELRPEFEWARPEGASGYRFRLARDQEMTQPVIDLSNIPGERFTPAQDLKPGLYFWRVSASDAAGKAGPMGYPQQFRVLPKAPNTEPPVLDEQGLAFHWRPGEPEQRYQFQLATDSGFEHILEDLHTEEARYYLASPQPGTYFMRVKTIDSDGVAGPFGRTQSIEVKGPEQDYGWFVLIPAALMLLLAL